MQGGEQRGAGDDKQTELEGRGGKQLLGRGLARSPQKDETLREAKLEVEREAPF